MRLRTLESFNLLNNGLLHSYPSLKEDLETEIVIIGGGITGALISCALIDMGKEVIMVDKRDVGQGSTAATTSMIQYEIDVPMIKLSKMIGEESAVLCYREGVRAIGALEKLIRDNEIDCGFENKQSIYLAHNARAEKWLLKEFHLRKKHHLDVAWGTALEVKEKYGLESHGAIISQCGAGLDAFRLAHELIRKNTERGMKVFDQTCIVKHDSTEGNHVLITSTGKTIRAGLVVYCNGFEAVEQLKEKVCDLVYTYAAISEGGLKLNSDLKKSLLWTTHDPYLYMRLTEDDRVLVGGGDTRFRKSVNQHRMKEKRTAIILEELKEVLPALDFIEDFNWGGVFGSTKDGLPYIGESPEYPGSFFVLGFGGNGITFSVQAMEMIRARLRGEDHPLAGYYRFGR